MQQLEIVYSGIKGAILVTKKTQGRPPTGELPLFTLENLTQKAQFVFAPPLLNM